MEVESHFCANCLENIPLAEARMKKNRCATCFDCPSCTHTMSTRAVPLSTPNPDDPKKVITRKVYYLVCGFCRWTSRDIGLPDQTVATGGWPERENPNTQRINQLLEHYKVLATKERQEKDSSPMASLVLIDSFEKLPDQILYPYVEPNDLQNHKSAVRCQVSTKEAMGLLYSSGMFSYRQYWSKDQFNSTQIGGHAELTGSEAVERCVRPLPAVSRLISSPISYQAVSLGSQQSKSLPGTWVVKKCVSVSFYFVFWARLKTDPRVTSDCGITHRDRYKTFRRHFEIGKIKDGFALEGVEFVEMAPGVVLSGKKFVPRRSYLHYSDKFGLTAMVARKRAGLPPLGGLAYKDDGGNAPEVLASIATEEVEQLPEDIFTKPVDISKVTTLPQRLSQPDFQPLLTQGLLPVHKQFLIKRSQRCRMCEHNVSKPEYNPASTKFKIQLFAYYHVPEVRLVTCEPLRPGDVSELIIKLSNPTQHQTTIQFAPLPSPEEELAELDKELEEKKKKREADRKEGEAKVTSLQDDISLVLPSLTRQLSIAEDSRPVKINLTGDLKLPTCSVVLPPRDDAAEYDDSGDIHNFQDDIKVVVWRKANKAAVKLAVQPHDTISHDGVDVRTGFVLKYSYVNTITTLEQKTPQSVELQARVYLNIGKTVGSQ
uniref:Dynactin subunit 4 n=2 Tax=Timema TaxID=61471 RepID=A0A7R9G5E3_TIMSH|nr:unnamed protein product [Timema shepardi]